MMPGILTAGLTELLVAIFGFLGAAVPAILMALRSRRKRREDASTIEALRDRNKTRAEIRRDTDDELAERLVRYSGDDAD